jgi:putative ABC transport system substrate-binding protein
MRRRDFIVVLGTVTIQSAARAQRPGTQIVGYLNSALHDPTSNAWLAFVKGMKEAGYIEGQNFSFEMQLAKGQYDRLPELAKSLVDRQVSVIVAPESISALAAKGSYVDDPNRLRQRRRSSQGRPRRVSQPPQHKPHWRVLFRRRTRRKAA